MEGPVGRLEGDREVSARWTWRFHPSLCAGAIEDGLPVAGGLLAKPSGAASFGGYLPATSLMRSTISSVAFSGVHFSFTTRLIAFAQTFSLFSDEK